MIGHMRGSLARRVALGAAALALFFVLLMGSGAWLATSALIRGQVATLLQSEASLRAEKARDLVDGIAANYRLLAANAVVANALVDSMGREAYLQPLLTDVAEVNNVPTMVAMTDFAGRPLVWSRRGFQVPSEWVAQAIGEGRARARVVMERNDPILVVAEPVVFARTGTAEGALVWRLALKDVARRAAAQSGTTTGRLILDGDGGSFAVDLGQPFDEAGQALMAEAQVPLSLALSPFRMTIRIGAGPEVLKGSLDRLTSFFLAIGAATTLLVVLVSMIMGQRLTMALQRLAQVAADFVPGRGDRRAFLMPGTDEIARLGAAFAGMVERLDRAYHDIERRSQTLLSNAERVAHVGSATWEPASGRLVWSDQFLTILGLVADDCVLAWDTFYDRIHPDDRGRVRTALEQAVAGESDKVLDDFRLIRTDGVERVAQLRAEVLRSETGQTLRLDLTIQDITERKAMEDRLDALVRELRRSNEELEQFAYVASHDLRQPLRTVRSYVTLVEEAIDDKLDPETREFVEFIRDGVRRMDALITDLLAYSRVGRTGKDGPVNSGRAIDLALMDLQSEMDDAHAEITVAERMPVVMGDSGEMSRLFQNLVGNAVKYCRDDVAPVINVGCYDMGTEWEFYVEDNGIGIDPSHSERIFGIFQRLHARDEYEGTGIGLAICRKVVERQGGRIWAEPNDRGGTTFRFSWPKMRRADLRP